MVRSKALPICHPLWLWSYLEQQVVGLVVDNFISVFLRSDGNEKRFICCVVLDDDSFKPKAKISKSRNGYVHIDVMKIRQSVLPEEVKSKIKAKGSPYKGLSQTPQVAVDIHDHMYGRGIRDPRREEYEDEIGLYHYELWNVNEKFSVPDFEEMVRNLGTKRDVRIVWIRDNEAHVYIFRTQLLKDDVSQYYQHAQQN